MARRRTYLRSSSPAGVRRASRRAWLKAALAGAAGVLGGALARTGPGRAAPSGATAANGAKGTAAKALHAPFQPGVPAGEKPYGAPSPFARGLVRRWLRGMLPSPLSRASFTPLAELEGIITPNGLVFERHHGGAPHIDPARFRLAVHGLMARPMAFTLDDLKRLDSVSRIHFLECAGNNSMSWGGPRLNAVQFTHGLLSCCEWTGVRLWDVLRLCGVRDNARWLLAEGADGVAYARSVPRELWDEALLVFAQNGEPLRPEQGFPLRLLVPGAEGSLNVKWLHRLKVGDEPWLTREETARYADLQDDGRARLFTLVQEANSVITLPCPEKPLTQHGRQRLSGIAWSGHGRITAVDVSFDGGVNWRPARLEEPVLPKCLTRFSLPFEWNGEELLLQSRAVDEQGNVQPTYEEMLKVKSARQVYHNNAITTWRVLSSGKVRHVRLG